MDHARADRERRFEALVARTAEPLQRYLRRRAAADTADEAFAEVLVVLWRRLDDVPETAALPWCYAVAGNVLANARRGEQRRTGLVLRLARHDPPATAYVDTPPSLAADDDAVRVRAALDRLRPDDAEVLRLWAWEGLAVHEIAVALAITANAAGVRLHRARRRLRDELHASAGKDPTGSGHMAGGGRPA